MPKDRLFVVSKINIDGEDYEISACVQMEDEGIGLYEYWGSIERHVDWQPNIVKEEISCDIELTHEQYIKASDILIKQYLEDLPNSF